MSLKYILKIYLSSAPQEDKEWSVLSSPFDCDITPHTYSLTYQWSLKQLSRTSTVHVETLEMIHSPRGWLWSLQCCTPQFHTLVTEKFKGLSWSGLIIFGHIIHISTQDTKWNFTRIASQFFFFFIYISETLKHVKCWGKKKRNLQSPNIPLIHFHQICIEGCLE